MSLVLSLGLALQRLTSAPVVIPPVTLPVNVALPTITGSTVNGQTLTGSTGTWSNSPTGYAYQWQRGGVAISGATAASYIAILADVGSTLTVTVTATNATGSAAATSTATAAVTSAPVVEPVPFEFALYNDLGATSFTSVPNLRVSLDGGTTWLPLGTGAAAGLTIGVDPAGGALLVDGFTDVTAQAPLFHFEQELPGEPNSGAGNSATNLPALFFRRVGGAAPVNTTLPGMTVTATVHNAPVGVA